MERATGTIFEWDPEIQRARTPPAHLYVDPSLLERERTKIFGRTWQPVARVDQVALPGAYAAAEVAGTPVVVVRGRDGALRAFVNVCLHRAGPVAVGCGTRQTLQCGYHGWTYALDGTLTRAAEMEGALHCRPGAMKLTELAVAPFGPLVWVNLDPAARPLAEVVEGIDPGPPGLRHALRREWVVECNWKVYVDNYLEGYHIPLVHPQLHKELDYDEYRVEPRRWASLQHAPLRPVPAGADRTYLPSEEDRDARYWWIFPNVMLNVYQGQIQLNVVSPVAPERCVTLFDWFAVDPPADPSRDPRWSRLLALSDVVQGEDIRICETVQRNLRSGRYTPGPYSPRRENGLHHFHGLLHEFLA